jgi:hypothetical protein
MRIAVFGSIATKDADEWELMNRDRFEPFCAGLGEWIAQKGHRLLVTSDRKGTADAAVVNGFARQKSGSGSVRVYWRPERRSPGPNKPAPFKVLADRDSRIRRSAGSASGASD